MLGFAKLTLYVNEREKTSVRVSDHSGLNHVFFFLKKSVRIIYINKERNSGLQYFGGHFCGAKYKSDKEIVVKFDHACSRILPL